jgi:hypothetical protein
VGGQPVERAWDVRRGERGEQRLPGDVVSRVERPNSKTSPEKFLAAAHASCYAMALPHTLAGRGADTERITIDAVAALEAETLDLDSRGRSRGSPGSSFRAWPRRSVPSSTRSGTAWRSSCGRPGGIEGGILTAPTERSKPGCCRPLWRCISPVAARSLVRGHPYVRTRVNMAFSNRSLQRRAGELTRCAFTHQAAASQTPPTFPLLPLKCRSLGGLDCNDYRYKTLDAS